MAITRRMAQSPQMRDQILATVKDVTRDVHKRRVKEWADSKEGPFPGLLESHRLAVEELAVLCDALGPLAAISPKQFDYAAELYHRPDCYRQTDAQLYELLDWPGRDETDWEL